MFVTKRTGGLQKFNIGKIQNAMYKAFLETYGEERALEEKASIYELAKSVEVHDGMGIEEIQDNVEKLLMVSYPEAARNFVVYREKRAKRRDTLKDVVYSSEHLEPSFLGNYENYPEHMNQVSKFTYLRTYSRDVVELGRRETYKETVLRSVDHNIDMDNRPRTSEVKQFLKTEAEKLFDMEFNLRSFLSGRALFTGGSSAAATFPLSLFNCSFIEVDELKAFYDVLYLLSVGAGVGYRITWDSIDKLPKFRSDIKLQVIPYNPLPKTMRKDETKIMELEDTLSIVVGDSRQGWATAVRDFLRYMSYETEHNFKTIRVVFNNIRPAGEPLRTFGGKNSIASTQLFH